jgi:hypothetical protein
MSTNLLPLTNTNWKLELAIGNTSTMATFPIDIGGIEDL